MSNLAEVIKELRELAAIQANSNDSNECEEACERETRLVADNLPAILDALEAKPSPAHEVVTALIGAGVAPERIRYKLDTCGHVSEGVVEVNPV